MSQIDLNCLIPLKSFACFSRLYKVEILTAFFLFLFFFFSECFMYAVISIIASTKLGISCGPPTVWELFQIEFMGIGMPRSDNDDLR